MTITPRPPSADLEAQQRAEAETLLAEGETARATQVARSLLLANPTLRTARALCGHLSAHRAANPSLRAVRVALLSSFSIEFLHDHLIAWGLANGLAVELYQAGFGQYRQEILDARSGLYRFAPDVTILAVEGEDWVPAAYRDFMHLPEGEQGALVMRWRDEAAVLMKCFREHATTPLLIHNFPPVRVLALGAIDAQQQHGQQQLIAHLNDACANLARSVADVYVVDYAALVGRHGTGNWYDARMRHYARAPIAGPMQPHLVAEYMKFLRAHAGLARKCLVLDLDNTLWGGVLGEDGPAGVALGANYPGSAFLEFQRHVLDLHARGVILAIASKNNAADVAEMFATNKSMLLTPAHFSAQAVHWRPKSESLREIAAALNIGLEHMVFADDSAAERAEVRQALPGITVIDLPAQPERYAEALLQEGLFDTLGLSAEDRRRGDLYRQRAEAEAVRGKVGSVEDYYRDLEMVVSVAPVQATSLTRTAQLTQKTNQFNITTRRYTEAEVARRASDPDWFVATIAVRDRFGDNGIVGIVMAQKRASTLEIDTVLLSCRVIGRTIETAMLALLCDRARQYGVASLLGTIIPTAKNEPARELFAQHGFAQSDVATDGTTRWHLDLAHATVAWPEWLQRDGSPEASNEAGAGTAEKAIDAVAGAEIES